MTKYDHIWISKRLIFNLSSLFDIWFFRNDMKNIKNQKGIKNENLFYINSKKIIFEYISTFYLHNLRFGKQWKIFSFLKNNEIDHTLFFGTEILDDLLLDPGSDLALNGIILSQHLKIDSKNNEIASLLIDFWWTNCKIIIFEKCVFLQLTRKYCFSNITILQTFLKK